MNQQRRFGLGAAAALAAGALALLGASTASAAPQGFGDIDFGKTGSLTVHKYLTQTGSTVGDPSAPPAAGDFTDPVANVEFTVYPLLKDGDPIDLEDPAAWDQLKDLAPTAPCTAPTGYTLGTGTAMPKTDASGTAKLDLAIGAYVVCETDAPDYILDRATPFVVTVPLPHDGGWVYDVHTYPKNNGAPVGKTIEEQTGTGLGSKVKYQIWNKIPSFADKLWTGYAIRDTLDSRLTANPANNGVEKVEVDGVTLDASYYTVTRSGQTITVNFTAAGLAWLNDGSDATAVPPVFANTQAGKEIRVFLDTTITSLGDGVIDNEGELWLNNPGFDPAVQPPITTPKVTTRWGNLLVQKRAEGTTGTTGRLSGAIFSVYNAADPYAADCSTAKPTGSPVAATVGGTSQTQFTSDADGIVTVPGLFVSDSVNPVIDAAQRCYVLVEVQAPAGYVTPIGDAANTPVTIKPGAMTVAGYDIENSQQVVPGLPLTGSQAQIILILASVAGAAIVAGLLLVQRRRKTATATAGIE